MNKEYDLRYITHSDIMTVGEKFPDKRVKHIHTFFNEISTNGPNVREEKSGGNQRMKTV